MNLRIKLRGTLFLQLKIFRERSAVNMYIKTFEILKEKENKQQQQCSWYKMKWCHHWCMDRGFWLSYGHINSGE